MHFLIVSLVLGFAAVFVVPFITGALAGFAPDSLKSYLPAQTVPSLTTNSIIQIAVFGAVLGVVLHFLRRFGAPTGVRG